MSISLSTFFNAITLGTITYVITRSVDTAVLAAAVLAICIASLYIAAVYKSPRHILSGFAFGTGWSLLLILFHQCDPPEATLPAALTAIAVALLCELDSLEKHS